MGILRRSMRHRRTESQDFRHGVRQVPPAPTSCTPMIGFARPAPSSGRALPGNALHLGVVALHRGEIQFRRTVAAGDGRRGAAAEADQHRRTAEHDHASLACSVRLCTSDERRFARPTGNHDRLVVSLTQRRRLNLERAEIAAEAGPALNSLLNAAAPSGPSRMTRTRWPCAAAAGVLFPTAAAARECADTMS